MTGGRCAQCERYLDPRPGLILLVELSPHLGEPIVTRLCGHGCLASWTLERLRELDDAREGKLPGQPAAVARCECMHPGCEKCWGRL